MSSSDSSTPPIRGFQFDSGAIGNLKNSVNLFRGDVNFHQKLLSLTARPGKQELDVDVSILYQSNIHDQTQKWNRDSATGILGLGWEMPKEGIGMHRPTALSPATKSYYYEVNGSKNNLIREPGDNPYRFNMSTMYTPVTGSTIGADIQAEFAANGIVIDAQAEASESGENRWLISDDKNLQLFEIIKKDDRLEIFDGGESYQLQNYSFWKVLYYPKYERWLVVRESGVSYSYGGFNPAIDKNKNGYNYSLGNSIQWAVCWTDPNNPEQSLWTGSSSVCTENAQKQYAKAWWLNSITDRWGDQVQYGYNQFGPNGDYATYSDQWRNETADHLPVVEQQVGATGLPYTKAIYLTSIIDSFGRKVIFNYEDKDYTAFTGSSTATAAREYLDPHRDLEQQVIASNPDTWPSPNAFQDSYETKYLSNIEVQSNSADTLFSIGFSYLPVTESYASYDTSDRLYGDTIKRQLMGITQYNEKGETLLQTEGPELLFEYQDLSGENAGALASITYPDGGVASYQYDQLDLDICDRKITITPPVELGSAASPRVFYGEDYVVSIWTNSALTKLSMRVYTWLGHWEVWQVDDIDSGSLLYDNPEGSIHVSGSSGNLLNVKTAGNYFVLSFSDGNQVQAYAFSKSIANPGQWIPFSSDNNQTPVCNHPSVSWPASSTVNILAGGTWFLALETTASQTRNLFRYTYRWAEKSSDQWLRDQWTTEQVINGSDDVIYLGTANDCYFQLSYSNGSATASLNWFDSQLNWQVGGSQTLSGFNLPQQKNAICIMGESFAVFSNQTKNPSSSYVFYDVRVFQWDADYQFIDLKWDGGNTSTTTPMSLQDQIGKKSATPSIVPNVVSNSLFACAGNIFRFDGQTWWSRTAENGLPIDRNASYVSYAYGEDYAVQGWVDNTTPKGNLIAYDPNTNGGELQWQNTEVPVQGLPASTPSYDPANSNWASSGNSDYLTVGANVYYRDFSANWQTQVNEEGYSIIPADEYQVNSAAMNNQAPSFITYFEYKKGALAGSTVGALMLKNGQVETSQKFDGERYYTSLESTGSPGNGLSPVGHNSLVTYPDTSPGFQDSQNIFLYRYAGQALSGAITHRPVISIEINEGFGRSSGTAYQYDETTAACDVSGNVVKYYQARSFPGCLDPATQKNGYKNQQYINGLISMKIENIPQGAVINWNDGGGDRNYQASQNASQLTINNVTNTVLQSMTLDTPESITLNFVYGTNEFSQQYQQPNTTVKMFEELPAAPINNFQMLDGMLWKTQTYAFTDEDFELIASQENTWQPYTWRAGDLLDQTIPDYPLNGGLVLQTVKQNMMDGTVKTEVTGYLASGFNAPTTGQPFNKNLNYFDGAGQEQDTIETATYAYQHYSSFRCLHSLTAVVQKVTRHNDVVSAATADVFAEAAASTDVIVPVKSASFKYSSGDFSDFPFASYNPEVPQSWQNWLRSNLITVTNQQGMVVTSQDASGVSHSLHYDQLNQYTIASVSNAYFSPSPNDSIHAGGSFSVGEAAYNGFESYEDQSGWELSGGAVIDPSDQTSACDCHTGDRSLRLPPGAEISKTVQVNEGDQTYLIGFWYKSDSEDQEPVLQVDNSESYASHPAQPEFFGTDGIWTFQTVGVVINVNSNQELGFSWHNTGSGDVYLDDLVIMPMKAELGSHVYDPLFMYVNATHVSPGRTSRMLRNRFHQQSSNVAFNGQATELTIEYRSRQLNDQFDSNIPNAKLNMSASAGAVAANFQDGGEFAQQFVFSDLATHWELQGNSIIHSSNSNDQIVSKPIDSNEEVTSVAMYLEISELEQQEIDQPFSLSVGDYVFTWNPATNQWSGQGPIAIEPVYQKQNPRNMLLIRGNGLLALFADGQFIGSYTDQIAGDQITFDTGANQMQINQLIAFANPRLELEYYDGTGKTVQTQLLIGRDSFVTQTIYDEVGRDVVMTKAMPFSFQNTHGDNNGPQPTLQYRHGVVDTTDFQTSLNGDGAMTGDVADFYQGNSEAVQQWQNEVNAWPGEFNNSFTPTNDGNYPYSRKRYESSPLSRVVEKGQPGYLADGTLLAINLLTPPDQRYTAQYQFGYLTDLFTVPEPFASKSSMYSFESEIHPLKSRHLQIKDQQDNVVSELVYDQDDSSPRQYTQSYIEYTSEGSDSISRSPNYFSADSNRQSNNFETVVSYDLLGFPSQVNEADTGETLYLYDDMGRLRFEMPDQSSQENRYIKYTCYDNLSQVVCNGTLDASIYPWESLNQHLQDQSWPSAQISQRSRELTYGNPGDSQLAPPSNQIGQLVEVLTHNYRSINQSDVTFIVREKYTYTIGASVESTTQFVTESDGSTTTTVGSSDGYQVSYQYNNLQQLLAIDYPDGVGETLRYQYDELGRETNNNYDQSIVADYQYTAGENPASLNLSGTKEHDLEQVMSVDYSYISPELLQSGQNENGQNFGINVGDYSYNANGNVLSKAIEFELTRMDNKQLYPYQMDLNFNYDQAVNRLTSSQDSSNPLADINDINYDDNGNILELTQADEHISWSFAENDMPEKRSDLLSSISSSTTDILNNDSGQMTQSPNNVSESKTNVLTYDKSLGLTASVSYDSGSQLTFIYGSQGQRIMKRSDTTSGSTTTMYVSPGSHYLSEIILGDNSQITNYIYGQKNSLLGIMVQDEPVFPVSDQQGTILAWVDAEKNLLSSYQFLPFGKILSQNKFSEYVLPVIFTGQALEPETGLYNFKSRLYDPELRRFISPDPERQFASPFVYVGNNPISNIDANGEWSKDAIGGLVVSSLEIGLAISTLNFWAVPIGITGLTNTLSHKDAKGKEFWKNYAYSEIGTVVGIGEVAAGVALTVFTDGAGGAMGGASLIGAGISAISYSTFHEGDFDWGQYAKAQVIGAVGGLITGGVGAIGGALSSSIASEAALMSARGIAGLAVEGVAGITAGVTSSLASTAISAAWDQQSINWKSALINAGVSGALGVAGVGASRLGKSAFSDSIREFNGEGAAKASGFRKFIAGRNGNVISQNSAGNIRPNPNAIANLAKPVAFNSKKPVVASVNEYYPSTKDWI